MPCDESTKVTTNEEMRRVIFENAMKGNWEYVVNYCSQHPWLCSERVTRLGNAALHLAVSDRRERVVRDLIGIIESRWDPGEAVDVLETRNVEGNTPLHLAVLLGDVAMCRCICDGRPQLVAARNKEGETPLFLAARVGEIDAFACLLWDSDTRGYVKVRNQRGDTILHCAISGEHWKLAFLILQRFPDLHDIKNEKGLVPLHVLADKPGAFRSGTYLSLFDRLIYDLIPWYVGYGRRKDITSPKATNSTTNLNDQDTLPPYMMDMLEKRYNIVQQDFTSDEDARKVESQVGRSSVPPNYYICFTFISLVTIVVRPVVEMWRTWLKRRSWSLKGQNYIQKMMKKKETNLLSVRIMNRLLELQSVQPFDFDRAGWNPSVVLATNPFAEDRETKKETELDGGLPDMSQLKANEGAPGDNDDKEKKTEGELKKKTSKEGSNWAVVFKLDKDEPRPDVVFVRGVGGDSVDAVTKACSAAKNLDEKLRRNKAQRKDGVGSVQTPILLAAKNGIKEMVKKILEMNPIAIHDVDMDNKNAVLLAVENRQPKICELLLKKCDKESSLFRAVDKDGCSALHLAAKFSDKQRQFIPGAALQMQCEVLWFEYVKNFMMPKYCPSHSIFNETADEIFKDHHKELMEKGKEWLKSTSNSCSLVATIIATMAFATAITVPGGARNDSGKPYLEHHPPFRIFAISSLVALCFSVTSIIMFLAILTSRNQETDFGRNLPRKLLLGLTTLFISIVAMLVNFCSSHFFVLQDVLKRAAFPVYAVTCLPATYFAVVQLPLYIDLLWATCSKVPPRWMKKDDI